MSNPSIEQHIITSLTELALREGIKPDNITLEIPRQKEFGELACNVAMHSAAQIGIAPRALAERLAQAFPCSGDGVEAVNVAGPGFLNFKLAPGYFHRLLAEILQDPQGFGSSTESAADSPQSMVQSPQSVVNRRGLTAELGENRWLFEFVSANPTGPLNVVSARAASVGDALVRIFRKRGYTAHSEYYFNDGGKQVLLFGASVRARLAETEGRADEAVIPEDGYQGEYVIDVARSWRLANPDVTEFDDAAIGRWAVDWMLKAQQAQLARFRVSFDRWFRENELYDDGRVETTVKRMTELGITYDKDDALYLKTKDFGDTDDRVVRTSDGRLTYRVPDIAYHLDKFARGYARSVDLLGPDHHGHIITMTAAMKALRLPDGFYTALIAQQVNLKRGGEEIKMSKRTGVMLTLDELVDEVGVDAARFFFLRRKVSSPLDFDLELAKKHNDENPVYYVQYAHARICSILRQPRAKEFGFWILDFGLKNEEAHERRVIPAQAGIQTDGLQIEDCRLDVEERSETIQNPKSKIQNPSGLPLHLLTAKEELDLLRQIALFPWTLAAVVRTIEPHPLTSYLVDLARCFHLFYQRHRVISDDKEMTAARLALCYGTAAVIKEGLNLIGVEAPERM